MEVIESWQLQVGHHRQDISEVVQNRIYSQVHNVENKEFQDQYPYWTLCQMKNVSKNQKIKKEKIRKILL